VKLGQSRAQSSRLGAASDGSVASALPISASEMPTRCATLTKATRRNIVRA
jgi:hypothetical protein